MLIGLLQGVNSAADANRAERLRREELDSKRETDLLTKLATDDTVESEIRDRAATALLDIASGTAKRPRGGFLSRLLGADAIQVHPSVKNVLDFVRSPEVTRLSVGVPQESPSSPGAAAQATIPVAQPGGGPATPAALGSPAGPSAAGQGSPPPSVSPSAGPPPVLAPRGKLDPTGGVKMRQVQTAPVETRRRIFRDPAEIVRTREVNEAQGAVEGRVAGRIAMGMTRAEALALERTGARGAVGLREGEVYMKPDGSWVQPLYDATSGKVVQELPATAPAARSVSAPNPTALLAKELFGHQFPNIQHPTDVLKAATPEQLTQISEVLNRRTAWGEELKTLARMRAEATGPLSRDRQLATELTLQDRYQKLNAPLEEMKRQYAVMRTSLDRFGVDKVGAMEGIRVTFEKILDPASVVREGEYNRQGYGRSLLDRMEGFLQKHLSGGGDIPEPLLREMVETARQYVLQMEGWNSQQLSQMRDTATAYGIDPSRISPATSTTSPAPPPVVPTPAMPRGPSAAATAPAAGAPPPSISTSAPALPNAPQRGEMVGNVVPPGARTGTRRDGTKVAEIPGIGVVPIRQGPDGRWLY
jgi:hypothetical protein